MTFQDILSQAREWLQRDKRVTYRALQRQFALDEASLIDVKEAILFARLGVDEDGRGLVWAGETTPPAVILPPQAITESRFQALLRAVIALLYREQRVTYRTIKHVFDIEAALLRELQTELTFRQLAMDEDGKGLVWTGTAQSASFFEQASLAPSDPTILAPYSLIALPDEPVELPESVRSTTDAERRQLTVMFCDLADSTALAQQLDPEELREVIRAYQATAADVIQTYGGHIAQYLGDGLLIYFGWPVAHENDAQRAIHAGLGIVEAITSSLNARLERQHGVQLRVRLGVHTGPVVVGEMGGGGRHEHLATGDTVNIAARLESLATPNTVVISAATAQLVHDAFVYESLGMQQLKGIAEPLAVLQVLAARDAAPEHEENAADRLTLLVGRDEEVGLLRRRWEQAREGLGQVVLLSGEAGIGKSRLLATLRTQVRDEEATRLVFRCSPYHTNSVLYPVIAHLERLLGFERTDVPGTRLDKLEEGLRRSRLHLAEVVPLVAALLSVPFEGRYTKRSLTPHQQKQQTLDALGAWLFAEAEQQPVLVAWEDLHWADPSTLELLGMVLEQAPTVAVLHVLTFRPEFTPPWPLRSHITPLTLQRLERQQVEALVTYLGDGKALPREVVQHIVAKTDGIPLYVEELTKMLLHSSVLQEDTEHYVLTGPLRSVAIPDTLQDALMARLDQLGATREVAQFGAVLGREFSYEMLAALAGQDAERLQGNLAQLVDAELLYQRGRPPQARYVFKHALIRDAAYASLLKSTRQRLHQQVVHLLETRFAEVVATQPELLAQHCAAAGEDEAAVRYWQQAGQRALDGSAYVEATAHLRQGLAVLKALPETSDHLRQELDLQVALGMALRATHGYAVSEEEDVYSRAYELCQRLGDNPQVFPVLRGLILYYLARGQLHRALQLSEQLLRLAQAQPDTTPLILAHFMLGVVLHFRDEPVRARSYHTQSLALSIPETHRALALRTYGADIGIAPYHYLAWELWMLGFPGQAVQYIQVALTLATERAHPFSLAGTLVFAAYVYQCRRETSAVHQRATEAITLATERGLVQWMAEGTVLYGWALTMQGESEAGLVAMRHGVDTELALGNKAWLPYFLSLLAEAYGHSGQPDEGLAALAEAQAIMETTEARFYAAELYRLQGVLLLQQAVPDPIQAEACFQEALAIARRQQAKSWELRAATSLARLWQAQGKRDEAYDLLAPVYNWFTEGFDTADLQEAKKLLEDLA